MTMPLQGVWDSRHNARQSHLDRMRHVSALTIPSILPPIHTTSRDWMPQSYQSLGALGISNLVSTMLSTLFPPGIPWFRFTVTPEAAQQLIQAAQLDPLASPTPIQQVDQILSNFEQIVLTHIDNSGFRIQAAALLEQIIGVGQGLGKLNTEDNFSLTVWRLDQYTLVRAPDGRLLEIMIKERVDPLELKPEIFAKLSPKTQGEVKRMTQNATLPDPSLDGEFRQMLLDMYTRVTWNPASQNWTRVQELDGVVILEDEFDVTPYIAPRWQPMPFEHYGRGLGEVALPDLRAHDGLSRAILESSVAAAKLLFLVDPTGITKKQQVAKADNLAVLYGRAQDISTTGASRGAQESLRVAAEVSQTIEARLGRVMGMFTSVRRTGERVTALETQQTILELEGTFGGVFSTQAVEFQRPLLDAYVHSLISKGVLPKFDTESVQWTATTGAPALARASELQEDLQTLGIVAQIPGMDQELDNQKIASRIFTNRGMDPASVLLSPEQKQARQQAALQQQAQQRAIEATGNVAEEAASAQIQQQAAEQTAA